MMMDEHLCGGLLVVVMWIVLAFFLSMEPILTRKGDAFKFLLSLLLKVISCHSENYGSPLDIAMTKGHTSIVSMMTEALKCE